MVEFFNQGWVGSLIGLIGVILGILGLVAYRVSRIGPRPTFQFHSRRLIGKQEQELPTEIDVLFNKQPVPRLTSSRIVFWNSGNSTVHGNAIVSGDPLRCEFDDGSILKAHVIKATRPVINFSVSADAAIPIATFTFDFLDPSDGAMIEILHTSEKRNPKLLGTVRGVPKGIMNWGDYSKEIYQFFPSRISAVRRINKIMFLLMGLFGLLTILFALIPAELVTTLHDMTQSINPQETEWTFGTGKRIGLMLVGFLYGIPPAMLWWFRRQRFPRSLQNDE